MYKKSYDLAAAYVEQLNSSENLNSTLQSQVRDFQRKLESLQGELLVSKKEASLLSSSHHLEDIKLNFARKEQELNLVIQNKDELLKEL